MSSFQRDQDVHGRLRVDAAKRRDLVVLVDDVSGGSSGG